MSGMRGAAQPLAAAKQQLRQQMKQRLGTLSSDAIAQQSAAIFHSLRQFPPFDDARRVAVFLSMPAAEVQTDAIVRHALAAGKQVFVPFLHKPGPALAAAGADYVPPRVMDMVQLHDAADYASLARDRWGIPSVSAGSVAARARVLGDDDDSDSDSALASLDLILMPGVAFDVDRATGHIRRCGHGRGFYDYFLQRYARRTPDAAVRLYGLALSEQVLPGTPEASVPTGTLDRPLHGLITGDGSIIARPADELQKL